MYETQFSHFMRITTAGIWSWRRDIFVWKSVSRRHIWVTPEEPSRALIPWDVNQLTNLGVEATRGATPQSNLSADLRPGAHRPPAPENRRAPGIGPADEDPGWQNPFPESSTYPVETAARSVAAKWPNSSFSPQKAVIALGYEPCGPYQSAFSGAHVEIWSCLAPKNSKIAAYPRTLFLPTHQWIFVEIWEHNRHFGALLHLRAYNALSCPRLREVNSYMLATGWHVTSRQP